jgi:hypothetical protein
VYTKSNIDSTCLNCGAIIPEDANYCPSCGQKVELIRLPFTHLISEFFESIFNVDSGLLPTLKKIWLPGQLTIEFFRGKRKKYIRPIRLLLVTALLFLTILGFHTKNVFNEFNSREDKWIADEQLLESTLFMQRIHDHYRPQDTILVDSVYWSFLRYAAGQNTLPEPPTYYNDSLRLMTLVLDSISVTSFMQDGSISTEAITVSEIDAIQMSLDELCDYYGIEGFANRLFFKQSLKSMKDPGGLVRYMIGSVLWMFLLTIPSMAFILHILKGLVKSYYIEHLIFTIHAHSLYFLLMALAITIDHFANTKFVAFCFPIYAIWLIVALKRYYKRGWFKTLINFFLLNFAYTFVAIFAILFSGVIRFLLY